MKNLKLILCLALAFHAYSPFAHASGCGPELATFEQLMEQARRIAEEGRKDEAVAQALRAAANDFINQNGGITAASIPTVALEGLKLSKSIDPGSVKAQVAWTYRAAFGMPSYRELTVTGAKEVGIKRIYVLSAKGQLLANGKPVPSKSIPGLKIVVVVDANDERFNKGDDEVVWAYSSLDLIGYQKKYMRRRQIELYTRMTGVELPVAGANERLIEVAWITDHLHAFPVVPSSQLTIDFDYLIQGKLPPEEVISFIQYSLGTTGKERIVGSVRSGGSRYSR